MIGLVRNSSFSMSPCADQREHLLMVVSSLLDIPDADESIVKAATFENIQLDFNRGADSIAYNFEWIFAPNDYSLMLGIWSGYGADYPPKILGR